MSKAKIALDFQARIPRGYLNLMGYVDESEVNGPGRRAVVWVQEQDRLERFLHRLLGVEISTAF
jgi:hypothetical protein